MRLYIVSILLFSIGFLFFPSRSIHWIPNIQPVWIWNKEGGFGTKNFQGYEDPTKTLSGYKIQGAFYSFPSKSFHRYPEDRLIEYSILEEGFYEYKKLGDEVSYFNGWRELFWKKPYSSYPRPGYFSSVIPLVSGDGNTVFFADRNGNPTGVESFDGRFAVDLCYASRKEVTFVLFAGGEFILADEKGNPLTTHNSQETESYSQVYFAKSCAISPNGGFYAIHYQEGDKDKIRIYTTENSFSEVELDRVTPHKLHIAIDESGNTIVLFKDRVSLFNKKGRLIKESQETMEDYYNPVFATESFFIWGNKKKIVLWDEEGEEILRFNGALVEFPYRFLPGKDGNFYLESKKDIRQFVKIDSRNNSSN